MPRRLAGMMFEAVRRSEMLRAFESSRLKINRAEHHIADLELGIAQFINEHPYEIVIEADPDPAYEVHKCRLTKLVPQSFSLIAGDAIGNLRSALDHITYSCGVLAGVDPGQCKFPFGPTAEDFANAIKGRCKLLPYEIQACFARFNAYNGGNTLLWTLNEMRNRSEHTLITPICACIPAVSITVQSGSISSPKNVFWDRVKNEIELVRATRNTKYDGGFTLNIGFDFPTLNEVAPMVGVLNEFVNIVQHVLMAVEAQSRILWREVVGVGCSFSDLLTKTTLPGPVRVSSQE
jgi:hypothetical protein